jgi:hypothetical protein
VSQLILIFLSKSYFFSKPCLAEVDATLEFDKPVAAVHEADEGRGGAPLATLRTDCISKKRATFRIFDAAPIIQWHRIYDFQLLSLKLIAERIVRATPDLVEFSQQFTSVVSPAKTEIGKRSELFSSAEITRSAVAFEQAPVVFISADNPGAYELAEELWQLYSETGLQLTNVLNPDAGSEAAPQETSSSHEHADAASYEANHEAISMVQEASMIVQEAAVEWLKKASEATGIGSSPPRPTHFILYLNADTFVGESGARLAAQVRAARGLGLNMVTVHENDPQKGGCEFPRFFQTTPEDLIDAG